MHLRRSQLPPRDAMEEVWRTYFASIFNPARLKVSMMKSEMPVKYWRNLPEAELIPSLVRGAKAAEAENCLALAYARTGQFDDEPTVAFPNRIPVAAAIGAREAGAAVEER